MAGSYSAFNERLNFHVLLIEIASLQEKLIPQETGVFDICLAALIPAPLPRPWERVLKAPDRGNRRSLFGHA
jgi:hypothetical protein